MTRTHRGFSLLEMVAVVAVIATLAAIATFTYRRVATAAADDTATAELTSVWDQLRATAAAADTAPAAHTNETVAAQRRSSQLRYTLDVDPATGAVITAWDDGGPCARLVVPRTAEMRTAPAGPCGTLLATITRRALRPAAWWPLNHPDGDTAAAAGDPGPPAAVVGPVMFGLPSAAAHANDTSTASAAQISGGGGLRADDSGWADTLTGDDGWTLLTVVRVDTSGGDTSPLARASTLTLAADAEMRPRCEVDGTGTSAAAAEPLQTDVWYVLACRAHPDGHVSLLVNGWEHARARPALTPPVPDGTVWPAGPLTGGWQITVDQAGVAAGVVHADLLDVLHRAVDLPAETPG